VGAGAKDRRISRKERKPERIRKKPGSEIASGFLRSFAFFFAAIA
jgi:hypothetical protein